MEDKNSEDEVLRSQSFKRAKGLNLDSFMVGTSEPAAPTMTDSPSSSTEMEVENDAAIGEVGELFALEPDASASVDSTTQVAVHGEQQIGRGLAVSMVVVWTAIGAMVGTVLPPLLGGAGLLAMAMFGLYLGERWIRRDSMHLLGLTWVIISMKLLYGLALDAWRWGWFDDVGFGASETLGMLMLTLVGLNVALAFRHDEDAIAAQSALVLFAVGSSAGAVFGEVGIALFIVLAMGLMHGLALARSSGNLASLGISMSYLWIGVHALSDDWSILSLTLLTIENDLTLFLLLAVVSAANAAMAAAFVHHENWLSQAVNAVGLGRPGLWAVSVSLGMVGALMAIAAHRTETGYALAQLMLLTLAFTASYLVVRGVAWSRLMPFVLAPVPFLIAGVALLNTGVLSPSLPFELTEYSLFATATAALCIGVLLMHQTDVSDHVLWMGSMVVVVLLTLLIPADEGSGNARLLLATQGMVWVGLATMAVMRSSPSMAGVAVLAPYGWLLTFATDFETRLINADLVPVVLSEADTGWWMAALVVQQIVVCLSLGHAKLNLGAGFAGLSEISTRLRDSEFLNLWSLSFFLACATYVSITRPGGLTSLGLIGGMGLLLLTHAVMVWQGRHGGQPQTLVLVWSIAVLALTWRYGDEAAWSGLLAGGSFLLVLGAVARAVEAEEAGTQQAHHKALPGRLITLQLGVTTALLLVVALSPQRQTMLTGQGLLDASANLVVLSIMGAVSLAMYMHRLNVLDGLLVPSVAAVGLLVSMGIAGQSTEMPSIQTAALVLFVITGVFLAMQGDVRSGLKALAQREEREASFAQKREHMRQLVSSTSSDGATNVALKDLDAQLLNLAEQQRKRSKRSGASSDSDLMFGDIHYRPVVLLMFLGSSFLFSMWGAYATPYGLEALLFSAGFAVVLVGVARLRANSIGLRLPDMAGVELPIAFAMGGMVLVHIAGRMTTGVLADDALHQAVLMLTLTVLASMGLMGRNDLGLRIPSALELVLGLLVADRIICVFIGGEVPLPLTTDPLNASLSTWGLPLLLCEVLLLGAVLVYDWVEGERLKRELPDHRTALGRSAWMLSTVVLSLGIATVVSLVNGLRRGRAWQQPAVALTAVVATPFAVEALSVWALSSISPPLTSSLTAMGVGLGALVWSVALVRMDKGLWLSSALWAAHLLLYAAAVMSQSLVFLSLTAMLVSSTAWLCGIFTQRKSWRIVGAADLAVAWLLAAVALVAGTTATYVLLMLVASALLLFAVTTFTQTNEAALLDD